MKIVNRTHVLLATAMLCCGSAGCQDDRVQEAAPRVERVFVGDGEAVPAAADYGAMPQDGALSIDFGVVDVDTIARRTIFLQNTGRSALKLSRASMEEGSSGDFVLACSAGGGFSACPASAREMVEVAPGDDLLVQVSYAPRDVGTDQGAFTLEMNAAGHRTVRVTLAGEGVTPEIQVCITDCTGDQEGPGCSGADQVCNDDVQPPGLEMAFGDTDMDTAVRRALVIHNQGDRELQISSLDFAGGDFNQFRLDMDGHQLPGVLAAAESATVFVLYDPATGGDHASTLRIVSNDVNEREIDVQLAGRGMAPRVCPDPLVLDFGNVATGEPAVKTFSLGNCGLLDLELIDLAMNPDSSGDFSLANLPALPATLAPGASVDVEVQYLPRTQGTDHGGVDIFSSDPASDPATHLSGTVALQGASVPRECDIQATPFAVSFGGVVVDESETLELIVSNAGTDSCILHRVEIGTNTPDGEFSILEAPEEDAVFEPGESLLVRLQYRPVDLGSDSGSLSLFGTDKDTDEVQVDLGGEGVDSAMCDLQISPETLQFGTVKLNNTQSQLISVTNTGNAECHVDAPALYASFVSHADFTITGGPADAFVVARRGQPGDQVEIEITFAPQATGLHNAYFWLHTDDDPDLLGTGNGMCFIPGMSPVYPDYGDACVNVSGYSAESSIEVVPSELDFGTVTVGCNSPEIGVNVYNLGTQPINITDIYLENEPDPDFEIMAAPGTPFALQGGSSVEIRLRYHPQDTNAHRSNLFIQSDASNVDLLAVPLYGRGTNITDQTDVFHQADRVSSDVLFVVDNSRSMEQEQEGLATNFDAFIAHALTLDVDFHIGVVATDILEPTTEQGNPPRDIFPAVLVAAPGRPRIITSSTPDITGAFADNVRIGTGGDGRREAGLEAAWMALTPPEIDDPTKNAGFLREDAKLYLVFVSDEQDCSRGDTDFYVDFFTSIKGYHNPNMMQCAAVVLLDPDVCADDQTSPGTRYIDVARQTGGVVESICTSDWAASLANLGLDAFTAIREFPLSRNADPSTITVTVNASSVPRASSPGAANGWTYYPDTNSIFFGDNWVPDKGDRIEVHYSTACL